MWKKIIGSSLGSSPRRVHDQGFINSFHSFRTLSCVARRSQTCFRYPPHITFSADLGVHGLDTAENRKHTHLSEHLAPA